MSSEAELKGNSNIETTDASKPLINQDDNNEKQPAVTPTENTPKRKKKHVSALVAASLGRSAVDHAKAHSSGDVTGTSGLSNTGPFVSYENQE